MSALIRFGHVFLVQTFPYSRLFEYVWPACVCFRGFLNCLIHIHSQQVLAETPEEKSRHSARLQWCRRRVERWHQVASLRKPWESPFHPQQKLRNYIIDIYFIYRLSILKDFEAPFERYIIQIHTAQKNAYFISRQRLNAIDLNYCSSTATLLTST